MNLPVDELERLRQDWQRDERPRPEVQIGHLRRRLWRRWLGLATDVAATAATAAVIIWAAGQVNGLMSGIYVGFFALTWVVLAWRGARIRMQGFRLRDTSPAGVIDQALRQARATVQSGRMSIAAGSAVFAFFLIWLALAGHSLGKGPMEVIATSLPSFLFVTLVCAIAVFAGYWMIERGRNRERRLRDLLDQLTEREEGSRLTC
ncbi:MAG: hypothetical protein U5L08_10055 [Xanthomonadales bacterium]|nr:hypothetical protein [Xanthomonadales bacterium]